MLQVLESEIDDECDIPVHTLREFSGVVGEWLSEHLNEYTI